MLTVVMVVLVCVVHKTLGAASWIDGKQNITVYYRINGDTLFDWGYNSDETIDFIRWWFEPTGASSPSVIMAITSGETSPTVVDDAYKTRLKWDNSTPAAMTLIKTQTKDIEGVYSVTVSLSVTRKLPDGYTVDFQEIPTFTSWPEIVTSYRGQSATLTWTLSKPLSTKWYSIVLIYEKQTPITICTWQGFNPNKIYYGSGYNAERVRADIKTGSKIVSYTLYNLQSDDVRYNYKCQVRTIPQAAVSNTEAWILLYEIPSSPVINRSPSNAVVNRVLTLTCSARSTSILPNNLPTYLHPTMEYRWQRDKSNISNDGRHTVNGNVLTIDKVQRQDHHTTYRCIAQETGSRLSDYKDLTLNVMYGPYDIKATPSGNITQTENDSLTLTCAATCNPNCSYKWTKDGQQISNSDKLYFGNIKRQEQGTYRCLASNDIGTDQHAGVCIQVYYPPELHTTVTPSGDLIQGSEVTLMCTVDSRPVPSSVIWSNITLSDMTVFDNNKHNNTHCWLTLSDINILHSGNYQCRADNGVRGSPVTVNKTITVHGPPRWYKLDPVDKVIGASVGDRVNFKVWVIARPLPRQDEWQWKFSPTNSSNIINTKPGQVDLTVSGDMALLSITSVTINHYGNYYIWAKNKYGGWNEEDLSFSLKPQVFYPLIVGAVLGTLVLVMFIVMIILLWRKGFLDKCLCLHPCGRERKNERTKRGSNQKSGTSVNTEEENYDMPKSHVIEHTQPSGVYETLLEAEVNIFESSSIILKYLVCDGEFYQTWQGKLSDKVNSPLQVVIKKTKGNTDVYIQYLQTQGLYLTKMRSNDHMVACLGMTSDWRFLVMEEASLGNLKQYLETRATETYYNVTNSQSFEINCIHQINEGIQAIHQLDAPALFYCLSASNVLLSGDMKCKLSGFSSAEAVRAREKWEEDNKLTRPVQWLSPEAITLNHVTHSDVWSFGILMWEIFSGGKLPFGDISDNQARQKILSCQKPTKPLKCSDEVYDIMTLCWMRLPYNRPSLQDISLRYVELTHYEDV